MKDDLFWALPLHVTREAACAMPVIQRSKSLGLAIAACQAAGYRVIQCNYHTTVPTRPLLAHIVFVHGQTQPLYEHTLSVHLAEIKRKRKYDVRVVTPGSIGYSVGQADSMAKAIRMVLDAGFCFCIGVEVIGFFAWQTWNVLVERCCALKQ